LPTQTVGYYLNLLGLRKASVAKRQHLRTNYLFSCGF
jgi:hypothetical protein